MFSAFFSTPSKSSALQKTEVKEFEKIEGFLKHVVKGEQDKAEEVLKKIPGLALKKGTVMDLSQREFKNISGFQYALWALDWHMWRMLLKYIDKEEAAFQLRELEKKGTAYGKHFNLQPLIEALNTYVRNQEAWNNKVDFPKREWYLCHRIGSNQLLLPVHIVNEYCHPDRPFFPPPQFTEKTLPRSTELFVGRGEDRNALPLPRNMDSNVRRGSWFTLRYNEGKLGHTFAVSRYNQSEAVLVTSIRSEWIEADAKALQSLWKRRLQQLEGLKQELTYLKGVSSVLTNYVPPVLKKIISEYLADADDEEALSGRTSEKQSRCALM